MNAADGRVAMALHTADDIRICDGVCVHGWDKTPSFNFCL